MLFVLVIILLFGWAWSALPLISAGIAYGVGKRFLDEYRKTFALVLSALVAQMCWLLVSIATDPDISATYPFYAVVGIILISGAAWLGFRPGRLPLIFLSVFSGLMLFYIIAGIWAVFPERGTDAFNTGMIQASLWALNLTLMLIRMREMRSMKLKENVLSGEGKANVRWEEI